MDKSVRPEIYGVMSIADVESQLRRDKMPAPFIRRMRVINLLSALTLRKIEDNMIAPFKVMDIHHVLNEQISQDAIIAMLENKNLALALETGDLQPLWVESKEKPLLRKGFEQGWMQRFNKTPFDPICVMLAMRAKLMLDVVDEEGHSYDLLRAIGMGWIDFGEIPGEEIGDPDNYVPPMIDQPIDYPDLPPDPVPGDPDYVPGPGEPGYIPPEDLVPGDPGYTPGPGEPGYIPPGDLVPGEPGYVPGPDEPGYIPPPDRVPGDPGYPIVSGESPGYPEGWDEAIHPGHPDYEPGPGEEGYTYPSSPGGGYYGGDYGPGGGGIHGGPSGKEGIYSNLAPPLHITVEQAGLFSSRHPGLQRGGGLPACCLDLKTGPETVKIGGGDEDVGCGGSTGLVVAGYHLECGGGNYSWEITAGGGSLSSNWGLFVTYTAPAHGSGCPGGATIAMSCGGEVMDTVEITLVCDCGDSLIGYTTQQMAVDENQSLSVENPQSGCIYDWAITSGGGSLSAPQGTSTVYTAPSANANCEQNPTISLTVGGVVCDILEIAVNAYTGNDPAYEFSICEFKAGWWQRHIYYYRCDGQLLGDFYSGYWSLEEDCEAAIEGNMACPCWIGGPGYHDCRGEECYTPSLLSQGCCPKDLL